MAGETLKTAQGLLDDFPDNSAGLIEAVHVRNFLVGAVTAVGFSEGDPATLPLTIPLTDGVPVDVLSALPAPDFAGNFWTLDGNQQFVPDYVPRGITVPTGLQRLLKGQVLLLCEKLGNATPVPYVFQGTEGGVLTGNPITQEIAGGAEQLVVMSGTRLYDVAVGGPISFNVTASGHSDDLIVYAFRVSVESELV